MKTINLEDKEAQKFRWVLGFILTDYHWENMEVYRDVMQKAYDQLDKQGVVAD